MRAWTALFVLCIGCSRGAGSAEEGRARLRTAVESVDASAFYELVDEETRWSMDSAFKYHQQCLDLIEQGYPPEMQPREKARFVDGEDVRKFLAAYEARYHMIASLRPRVEGPDPVGIVRDKHGRWVFAGLRA